MTQSVHASTIILDDMRAITEWLEEHDLAEGPGFLNGPEVGVSLRFASELSGQSFIVTPLPADEGRELPWQVEVLEPPKLDAGDYTRGAVS